MLLRQAVTGFFCAPQAVCSIACSGGIMFSPSLSHCLSVPLSVPYQHSSRLVVGQQKLAMMAVGQHGVHRVDDIKCL